MADIKAVYAKEFDLYDEVFKIKYGNNGLPYSKVVPNAGMVTEVLNRLKDIWSDLPTYKQIIQEESDRNLTCLLLASKAPHITIPAMSRNLLFSEKLFIPHPMLHYLELIGINGPYYMPDKWSEEVMKSALYICALRDWIADDFLRLIPFPSQWSNNIKQRIEHTFTEDYMNKAMKDFKPAELYKNIDFTVELMTEMEDDMREFLLNKIKREDRKQYDEIVIAIQNQPKYPDWLKINRDNAAGGKIWHTGTMLHPVEVKYLMDNWNIYVNPLSMVGKYRLVKEIKTKYNIISNFIDDINIKFPQNAPLDYIYDCRKSGLLSDFRKYLLEQYEQIRCASNEEEINSIQDKYNRTIFEQVDHLNNEMKNIYKDLAKDILDVGMSNIGLGFDLLTANFSTSSFLNVAGGIVNKVVPKIKRISSTKKNPLIVLHKLKSSGKNR